MKLMEETIAECIEKSGKSMDDIECVEIIGGASRVPWFQRIMEEKFGKILLLARRNHWWSFSRSLVPEDYGGEIRYENYLISLNIRNGGRKVWQWERMVCSTGI
jgi:hypothetical protein